MDIIKTIDLTKSYGKSRGICNLNLTVKEGDFFGFIGPNGAGKSTAIRTLLGLIYPSSGQAFLFDESITKKPQHLRKRIGYLPSEAVFYKGMKVKEVLKLSAKLRNCNCEKTGEQLCERLKLDLTRKVEDLSFGNRKKVGIVCALQHMPELLILDEPTSGLDPLIQKEFFDILKERNQQGSTIFLSSHVLSEIQRNCKNAAIIREGSLIVCDSVEELAKTNAKRVVIHGRFLTDGMKEIKDIQRTEDGVSFLFSGDINGLLQELVKCPIQDLSVAEPDLDEIFMHYYTEGGNVQ